MIFVTRHFSAGKKLDPEYYLYAAKGWIFYAGKTVSPSSTSA
jgi:hypothetical protein